MDLSEMSLAEKLHRFMLFVRDEHSARVNDIQTIENAITGCHLDLKTSYEAEDVGVYQGRHTFSGKLMLSGIFLARAVGQVKKELKHECYKLALQVGMTSVLFCSCYLKKKKIVLFHKCDIGSNCTCDNCLELLCFWSVCMCVHCVCWQVGLCH